MQAETPQPPVSSTAPELKSAATGEAEALRDRLEQRRKQLGIDTTKPLVKRADFPSLRAAPEPDPVKEQAAADQKARLDAREEDRRRKALWRSLCVDGCEAYADVSTKTFRLSESRVVADDQQSVVRSIEAYVDSLPQRVRSGEGVVFFGPCGTGKDHLAMSICREAVLSHGFSVERINGQEWYGRLRDLMGQGSSSEEAEVRRLAKCDLLLISDPVPPLGDLSPYQASMLYRVLEKRYGSYKATIVTANVEGAGDAAKRMGAATMERMKGRAWIIACNWPSFRKPSRVIGEP